MGGGAAPRAQVLFLHSSSGHYGADRRPALLASGLDPDRYRPIVVLPPGELAGDLLDDEAARERLGEAAAADVRARFDPARLIAETQSLPDAVRS